MTTTQESGDHCLCQRGIEETIFVIRAAFVPCADKSEMLTPSGVRARYDRHGEERQDDDQEKPGLARAPKDRGDRPAPWKPRDGRHLVDARAGLFRLHTHDHASCGASAGQAQRNQPAHALATRLATATVRAAPPAPLKRHSCRGSPARREPRAAPPIFVTLFESRSRSRPSSWDPRSGRNSCAYSSITTPHLPTAHEL